MKIRMFTLPNFITLANLACGCAAIVIALSAGGRLNVAFWFLVAAAVCDFADGFTARLTGQYSEIGVELDSLADMVSFGVAPSAVLWVMYRDSLPLWSGAPMPLYDVLGGLVFSVALFSALRLAKFNVDKTQSYEFSGLPTPAAALAIAAMGWTWYVGEFTMPREVIVAFAALVSWLLICPVKMFSLKFRQFGFKGNELKYCFLAASLLLVGIFGIGGVAFAVGLYVLTSAVRHFYYSRQRF